VTVRASRGALGVLFLTVFLDLLGFGLVIPLLPLYAKQLSVRADMVGPLFAVYSAMQFLFAPVWGAVSDRIGRRPVILVSDFGSVVAYALLGLASGPALLFIGRGFGGLCGANLSTAQAYIADVTTDRDRAKGMGMIGAAFGLGFVLGPAVAGIVSHHYGLAAPAWVASALSLVNLVSAALALPEPPRKEGQASRRSRLVALADALRTPRLGMLLVLYFIVTFAFAKLEVTFSLWLAKPPFHFNEEQVGWRFMYIGLVMSLIQGGLVGRVVRRFGEASTIKVATGILAAGFLALPLAASAPHLLLLIMLPIIVGNGLNNPSIAALISKLTPPERQGEVLGVGQSMSSLGRIFGPPAGSFLFEHVGINTPYQVGGAILAGACLLAIAVVRPAPSSQETTRAEAS
jgi:MFS family permease